MAGKKERIFQVAVVGMSGTTKVRGDLGVGKSCLCNRLMRSHADEFHREHINVISQSDFSGRIVNNDHFIYWGQVAHGGSEGGPEAVFRVVEQTEFIDDSSFTPLRGSVTKPYLKRAAETKLSSSEKLMYICKDQVGDDLGYDQKLLPEGKLQVDGFIMVFDVSRVRNRPLEAQVDFLTKLHGSLHKTKKPVVMVATKCDSSEGVCLSECKKLAGRLKVPLVETSAVLGVNIQLPFLLLAAQIDKSRSKPKEASFMEANRKFREQLKVATDQYLELLQKEVTDYHNVFSTKKKSFESGAVYKDYIALAGTAEAKKQFRNHTRRLKQGHQQRKREIYFSHLPDALREIFPTLESIGGRDWQACRDALQDHPAFIRWFVNLSEPWDESEYINTEEELIPYNLLTPREVKAENIFMAHVNQLNAAKRKERMKEAFRYLLEKMDDVVLPGSNFHVVKGNFDQTECYTELLEGERVEIFLTHQQSITKRAKEDFLEILLENTHLFTTFKRDGNIEDHLSDLQDELCQDKRYQVLAEMESDRYVMLLKYLAFTHSPVRDSCFMHDQDACMDRVIQHTLDLTVQKTPVKDSLGKWSTTNGRLQLLILGEDGLAEELANEIRNSCIDEEYPFDGSMYSMQIRTVDKDIIQGYNQFSADFTPQGCICVFTSLQSFQHVKTNLERTSLVDNVDDDSRPLRNLPVTLMFGRDSSIPESDFSALREEAQKLARRINDCEIVDTEEGGNFFQNRNFNENQIQKAFRFMVPRMNERARWVGTIPDPEGTALKLRVVMMCGDSYSPDFVLAPLIKENACHRTPNIPEGISLETFIGVDRKKVDVEVLSFHQALLEHKDITHAYILAYSTKRRASLEVLKTFLKRLARVPVLMLAVCEESKLLEGDYSDILVREGNKEADSTPNVKFLTAGPTFPTQTLAYSTFLKDAYSKRQETEKIHNESHFRKLPTPPPSPITPSGDSTSLQSDNDSDASQPTRPPARAPQEIAPGGQPQHQQETVFHDHLVKPSDIKKRQSSKELYDHVTPTYNPSTIRHTSSSSEDLIPSPIYAQVHKPRRIGSVKAYPARPAPVDPWVMAPSKDSMYSSANRQGVPPRRVGSFHSTSRGYTSPYAEPETHPAYKSRTEVIGGLDRDYWEVQPSPYSGRPRPVPAPRRPPMPLPDVATQRLSGWTDNVAYSSVSIPPPPNQEPPQPPSPYGVVPLYGRGQTPQETDDSSAVYDSVHPLHTKVQKPKPPVKPRPKHLKLHKSPQRQKLDPAKYQHLDQTLSQGPRKTTTPPYHHPVMRSPDDAPYGYSMPQDALQNDPRIGMGVYSEPVNALGSGQNQKVRVRGSEKQSPKSSPGPISHDKHREKSRKKNHEKKKKRPEESERDQADKFMEELNRLIGQAADDVPITKSNRVDPYPTIKDNKKQKKVKQKKVKKVKGPKGKPKGHLRDLPIEELKVGEEGVPPFVQQCTAFIEREGLTSEGIYRMPGKTQDIDDILTNFDQDPDFNLESLDMTVNAVASSIKQFFTRLPEPIIPYDMQHELIERYSQISQDDFCVELYRAIHSITPQRFAVLKHMMLHLERIMEQSAENKMTADNISTCWWPSMLHPRSQSFEDLAIEAQLANIFRLLIERTDYFFLERVSATEEEAPVEMDADTQQLLGQEEYHAPEM